MIESLVHRHGLRLDTDRGQHFLDDKRIVERMVEEADISPDETVLEIGAGLGTITRNLADAAGQVVAYENDPELLPALREELDDYNNIDVREEDMLSADIPDFDACVSNIPFHLSGELIELLGGYGKRAVLLVQDEFAQRLVAEPGDSAYSRITVRANYHFIPVYLDPVPGDAFFPVAEVDGALVKLFPRNDSFDVDEEFFFTVVTALFTHRRKKVRNAFYNSRHFFDLTKEEAKAIRDDLPHSEQRAVNCGLHELVEIAGAVQDRV